MNPMENSSSEVVCGPLCAGDAPQASAPREVRTLPKVAITKRLGDQIAVALEPQSLCEAFGVDDPDLATGYLSQLVGFLHPDIEKPLDPVVVNRALAAIRGIQPKDSLEAMLAVLLVAGHHAAVDAMRRACHPAQTPSARQSYFAITLKAARTCSRLVETLQIGRGKTVRQDINVTHQHVVVEAGGQATVGAINARGGRG